LPSVTEGMCESSTKMLSFKSKKLIGLIIFLQVRFGTSFYKGKMIDFTRFSAITLSSHMKLAKQFESMERWEVRRLLQLLYHVYLTWLFVSYYNLLLIFC